MTLSRSAGAHTDAVLRIERGGLKSPDASEGEIAPRLLLDGEPLALSGDKWRISPWLLVTDDTATITAFLQMIQEGEGDHLTRRQSDYFSEWLKSGVVVY